MYCRAEAAGNFEGIFVLTAVFCGDLIQRNIFRNSVRYIGNGNWEHH